MWNESFKFSYRLFGAGLITLKLFVFCDDHGSSIPASSMINKVKTKNRKDSWVCDDKETTSSQQQSPLLCRSEVVQLSHVQHLLLYKRQLKGAHAPPHGLQAFQMSLLWAPLQNVRPPQNPHPMPLQAKQRQKQIQAVRLVHGSGRSGSRHRHRAGCGTGPGPAGGSFRGSSTCGPAANTQLWPQHLPPSQPSPDRAVWPESTATRTCGTGHPSRLHVR